MSFPRTQIKRGVNPEFLYIIDCCNIWIFTMTYIQVYIFSKKMHVRIYFGYQISPKMLFVFEKIKKKKKKKKISLFLAQNICDKITNMILS